MDEAISRQSVIEVIEEYPHGDWNIETMDDMVERIKRLQPIQPEIVRCKDCKHFESEYGYCDYYQWNMTGGDFCSKAEKREVTT